MKARQSGTIINMSSIAGRKVYGDHTVYCGTKYFVHAVSESIRGYLSPHNVRVIVMSPGNIEAEVLNGITDPNDYTIDVVIPASSEINPNADQPRIYLDYEGKCKSIVINDGAKVTIENSGKLIIKEWG